MTRVAPTPALARLRGQFTPPSGTRVVYHGSHESTSDSRAVEHALQATFGAMLAEGACDGACWALPSATVQRDGHQHRFPFLRKDTLDELSRCAKGQCDDEYAGRGAYGLLERMGRQDGSFADAVVRGAFGALAQACSIGRDRTGDAVRASGFGARYGVQHVGNPIVIAAQPSTETPSIDLHLLEGDPYRVIDGFLVAAVAVGAERAVVHLLGQPPSTRAAFENALAQARQHGILDGSALGGTRVEVEVRDEAPDSAAMSVEAVAALSTVFDAPPPPTRLVALGGAVPRPGVYEVPVGGGTTWTGVLALAGAAPGLVPGLMVGTGGAVVLPDAFEELVTPEALGDGSVVVLPGGASPGSTGSD